MLPTSGRKSGSAPQTRRDSSMQFRRTPWYNRHYDGRTANRKCGRQIPRICWNEIRDAVLPDDMRREHVVFCGYHRVCSERVRDTAVKNIRALKNVRVRLLEHCKTEEQQRRGIEGTVQATRNGGRFEFP